MKKILSILMAILMLVSVVGSVPTVFAEEVNYTLVNESEGKFFGKNSPGKTISKRLWVL